MKLFLIINYFFLAGPALAGQLYEILQNYYYSFYIGGLSCIVGSLILIILILIPDLVNNGATKKNCELVFLEESLMTHL